MTYRAAEIGQVFRRDDRELVHRYGRFAAPYFRLEISDPSDSRTLFQAESQNNVAGYDLNGLIISDVEWDENDCTADVLTLTVNNIDLRLHNTELFKEGNNIDLWMGYDGHQPDYMGRGIISNIEPDFPNQGIPTIRITAHDISYFLMEEGRAEVVPEGTEWVNNRLNAVAQREGAQTAAEGTQIFRNIETNATPLRRFIFGDEDDPLPEGFNPQTINTTTERSADRRNATAPPVTPASEGGPTIERNTETNSSRTRQQLFGEEDDPLLENITASSDSSAPSNPINRSSTTRAGRRNRGKVWRDKTDAEIVETVFKSYGIVPFIDVTNTRVRTQTIEIQNRGEIVSTHIRDTAQQALAAQAQQRELDRRGITDRQIPRESVELNGPELDLPTIPGYAVELPGTITTIQSTTGGRRVVQKAGTSDWDFIKQLAAKHSFISFVFFHYSSRRWIGYWGPPQNVPQYHVYTFKYNYNDESTLCSFRPQVSLRGQSTEIDLQYVDPRTRREYRLRVSMENISRYNPEFRSSTGTVDVPEPLGDGPEVTLTIHGQRTRVIANRNFVDVDDARKWLMGFWLRYSSEFCLADGDTVIGLPEVRARQFHTIIGIGRYDGKYFITKSTHKMGTGKIYQTSFSCHRVTDLMESMTSDDGELTNIEVNEIGELPSGSV